MTRPAAAVLGHPVAHSLSPLLHAAAYRELGLDWDYTRLDVPEPEWERFWAARSAEAHWRGFSVTMPLKPAAARAATERTDLVAALGVANTLTVRPGAVVADNTDVMGIMAAVTAAGHVPETPHCAILGGGGTATAALAALHALGATRVDGFVRSEARSRFLTRAAQRLGAPLSLHPWAQAARRLADYDVVVATLPPHGADDLAREFATAGRAGTGVLLDAAYDPWPSALARAWRDTGGEIAPGLDMLVFQAVDQVRWFTQGSADHPLPHEERVTAAMCRAVGRPERVIAPRVRRARSTG